MYATNRIISIAAVLAVAASLAGCSPDKDEIAAPIGGADDPIFTNVQAALRAACGGCHAAGSGRTFIATMDSSALVASGLLNPTAPGTSAILVKARSTSHGGGSVAAFTTRDSALVVAWIGTLPKVDATALTAARTDFAPTIDGVGEALWLQAQPLTVPIGGGWAAATSVAVRAMYDEGYLYLYLRWHDNEASYRRNPWIKNADGTWSVAPAKPRPADGTDWAAYMAANSSSAFNPEQPVFMYEDKFALIWNTYATATHVPEFERVGCAAACHDPAKGNNPGTTYNYTRQDQAAKKYLTVQGQYLDMWHWKMVRHNMNAKIDDQVVKYWVPVNDASAANGGRGSDAGAAGYRDNPAVGGRPTYKSRTYGLLPPIYSFAESDTMRLTDAELAALPSGSTIANMITSMPTGSRGDIDAKGVFDPVLKVWTMEIRRRLVTADVSDVQFNDLGRTYKFGLAVFDNAQIEHSYSGPPLSLVFKR